MVRDQNLAVFELLTGIQADFERRGLSPRPVAALGGGVDRASVLSRRAR
jgi:hypothetical protein